MFGLDEFHNFGDGLELREHCEVEFFLVLGQGVDGHGKAVHLIQRGDNLARGLAAPGIEKIFGKRAIPLCESGLPGDVVKGHGVDDGAVAVEEICPEWTGGQLQFHRESELLFA